MAVLVNENTKVICQGITGRRRLFAACNLLDGAEMIVNAVEG